MTPYPRRRGSIFWALTLIFLGVLFLWQNFNPAIHPWLVIAKWWPVIIILWGVAKLVSYFEARAHPEAAAHTLFTAGEVILLVIILCLGTLLSRAILRPWGEWVSAVGMGEQEFAKLFLNSYTFTQQLSQPAGQNPRILLANRAGNIEVHGSDQPDISATVRETIWAENETAAKNIFNQLKIHFTEQSGQYVMETNMDSLPRRGHNIQLDFSVRAPRNTSMDLSAQNGDTTLDGLNGDQTLTARKGDLQVSNVEGLVRVHKSGGNTELRNITGNVEFDGRGDDIAIKNVIGTATVQGHLSGTVQFQNIAQGLRYSSSRTTLNTQRLTGLLTLDIGSVDASGVEGPFELSTREQDIHVDNFKSNLKITDTNGDVHLQTATLPIHPIDVEARNGDINLSLPAASSFQIDAASPNGDVSTTFPGLNVTRQQNTPSLKGTHGKGGPLIHLSSTYGTIRVMQRESQPSALPSPSPSAKRRVPVRQRVSPLPVARQNIG